MSEALEAVRDELSSWYLSLDPRTKGFLEAIYARAPAIVAEAVTGGKVTADESAGHATLAALLEADTNSTASPLPYIGAATPLTITPGEALTSTELTVSWTDANYGRAIESYNDELVVLGATGEAVFQTRIGPMALGENGQQAVTVRIPRLAEADYTVRVMHNAEGLDPQHVAYASRKVGLCSFSELVFTVKLDDANYGGPALPADGPNLGAFGQVDESVEYVPGQALPADVAPTDVAAADAPSATPGDGSQQYVSGLPTETADDGSDPYTSSLSFVGGASLTPEAEPEQFEQQPYGDLSSEMGDALEGDESESET